MLFVTLFCFATDASAQNPNSSLKIRQSNWQQRVDHDISVSLDVKNKILHCRETIVYKNNSPDDLNSIPMHIWPNAFSSLQTAYGKEAVRSGKYVFLNAKKSDLGYVDSLSFVVDGKPAAYKPFQNQKDIIELILPKTLKSGDSIEIQTPFRVKVPFLFSRMGYSGTLFSITQWYPKPAVYDINGWNTFPYLEQGEYYSEFGTYRVNITLPSNYIVGATGNLKNTDELEWITDLAENSAEQRSAVNTKTLEYYQENVSDFAWFADPDFKIGERDIKLANGHIVHIYAMLTADAKGSKINILDAIETALNYYSKRVGYYPYDFCTAVIGKLTAAGGMEYPMITICGDASEGTIIHEVGHNWFQGMLGNQERNHPWMDESINTFYQLQAEGKALKPWLQGDRVPVTGGYGLYRATQDLGVFQAGNLHSEEYQSNNYGTLVYSANPTRFFYLQEYLGNSLMDSCMKTYFTQFRYRHPLPGDIQEVFERVSGKELDWFFKDLLGDEMIDLKIQSVKKMEDRVRVKIRSSNKEIPYKLSWNTDRGTESIWLKGDTGVIIPATKFLMLNPSGFLTEKDISNNESRTSGAFKKLGNIRFGLPDLYKRGTNKVWVFPNFFTFNQYDGYTPGLILSNITFPRKNWEWWATPSRGIKSGSTVGMAGLQRNIFPNKGKISMIEIYLRGKTYNFLSDSARHKEQFYNFNPGILFILDRKKPWVQNTILLDVSGTRVPEATFRTTYYNTEGEMKARVDKENTIGRLLWKRINYSVVAPSMIAMSVEGGSNFSFYPNKFTQTNYQFCRWNYQSMHFIPYHFFKSVQSGLRITAFASGFIWQNHTESTGGVYNPIVSGASGRNDYAYRETLFGRSESYQTGNRYSQQLLSGVYSLRMVPNITADRYVCGINASSSFIPKVPVLLFADAAIAGNRTKSELYWASGISFSKMLGTHVSYELNLPLIYSNNFNSFTNGWKWYSGYSFKINLSILNPFVFAREVYR